jgi:DNA-binding transcriptional regulator LsrR (DeoR family)
LSSLPLVSSSIRLADQGVVAELCTTMINRNGQIVSSPLSDRLIAINHTQLAAVP